MGMCILASSQGLEEKLLHKFWLSLLSLPPTYLLYFLWVPCLTDSWTASAFLSSDLCLFRFSRTAVLCWSLVCSVMVGQLCPGKDPGKSQCSLYEVPFSRHIALCFHCLNTVFKNVHCLKQWLYVLAPTLLFINRRAIPTSIAPYLEVKVYKMCP